jgi:uncharacterized protein (DUF885 family)
MSTVRILSALLAATLLLAVSPVAQATSVGSADAQYIALAQTYYMDSFKRNPIDATFAGVHTYDGEMGDFSAAEVQRELAIDREYLAKLAAIDRTQLSQEVALDAQILENSLNDDLLLNGTLEQWKHQPDNYAQAATGSIFGIITRDYAPLATRARFVIAREKQIPAVLAAGRANTTTVDSTTLLIGFQDVSGSAEFFTQTVPLAFANLKDASLKARLKAANAAAAKAMLAYAAWIKGLKPQGTFAIGEQAYAARLKYEDGVDLSLSQYLAVGESELTRLHEQFVSTAKLIDPNKSPFDVYQEISKDHPAPDQLLTAAAGDLVHLRAFIISHHIITLPPAANIRVVETPPFERTTTTASFDSPGPLETVATQTYYNVTPVDPRWSAKQKEEYLEGLSNYERPIISAHECYPGHFVNYAIDKQHDLSLTRKLNWNQAFGEGWAHYSEQMMVDEGWGNGDPRVRLAQLDEALLRAARFVVGVKLHTQGMTIAQAEDFFVKEGLQGRQIAVEESLRGSQDAMYGYYTLGKLMILKLRVDYKKKMGAAYSLQAFHDALLAHGDPPIPLLRPVLLGSDDDGKIL